MTETGGSIASLFGLAPQGVCRAVAARAGRGALLPHRFTLATRTLRCGFGGLLSVALSVASPRLAVSQSAARWSSDFPPPEGGDPPIRFTRGSLTAGGMSICQVREIACVKLLLFQQLTIYVGLPTSKNIPIFRIGKV